MAQTRGDVKTDDGGCTANTCSVISARGSHGSGRYPCSPNEERRAGCRVPSPPLPLRSRVRADSGSGSCMEPGSLQRRVRSERPEVRSQSRSKGSLRALCCRRCFRRAAHAGIICIAVRCSLCPSPPTSPGRCSKPDCQPEKRERREAWRRTAECSVITSEKISGCGSEEGFIQRIV